VRQPASQGRADANQGEIKACYEELYCSVVDLHSIGGGCPDLVVGIGLITDLVEVKTDHGHILPSQTLFNETWRGRKVVIVRCKQDVIDHVQRVREESSRRKYYQSADWGRQ